ncbi:MAG TPA: HAMP domain-containing sensor histidine kinase [Polyangiaceae bacterium]
MAPDGDDRGAEAQRLAHDRLAKLGEIAIEIAHELRNVLQVISATAYVVRQETTRGDAQAALPHVLKIERSARAAHDIVDDLMALARGDLRRETVAIVDIVSAARAELAPASADWSDALEPPALRVLGHAGLLVRLLHALYENAIQASAPRPPRIVTRARTFGGRVVVEVSDDGPGVPADVAARVFDPLVTAREGGTGLGLSLARRIAEGHGGSIALVEHEGAGATFRVDLGDASDG